jgi:hypothetical protein
MDVGELHLIVRIEFIGVDHNDYLDRQHMFGGADCRRHELIVVTMLQAAARICMIPDHACLSTFRSWQPDL